MIKGLKHQTGQSLVYVIGILAAFMIMGAYTHNAYTISNEKTRLQSTADAASYSVAVVEARQLNFMAYTNRAMIANQVAVGQAIGIMSWSYMLEQAVAWLDTIAYLFPPVKPFVSALEGAVNAYVDVAEVVLSQLVGTVLNTVLTVLEQAQAGVATATVPLALDVMTGVIKENDPDVDGISSPFNLASSAEFYTQSTDFIKRYRPNTVRQAHQNSDEYAEHFSRMEEMRDAIMNSRDEFTRSRTYELIEVASAVRLQRFGSSDLTGENRKHEYGTWTSMDVISFEQKRWEDLSFKWKRNQGGVGGTATVSRTEEDVEPEDHNWNHDYGGAWDRASRAAESAINPDEKLGIPNRNFEATYSGLRMHYGLKLDGLINKGPGIRLILSKPTQKMRTAKNLGFNGDPIDLEKDAKMPGDRVYAMTAAEAYFARVNDAAGMPAGYGRQDGRREYGSLYNPYWHARLRPLNASEKAQMKVAAATGAGG